MRRRLPPDLSILPRNPVSRPERYRHSPAGNESDRTNRQPHSHAVLLRCEECVEDCLRIFQSYPGILYLDQNGIVTLPLGTNQIGQIASPIPMPFSFVVKNASKTASGSFNPTPESCISTRTVSSLSRWERIRSDKSPAPFPCRSPSL